MAIQIATHLFLLLLLVPVGVGQSEKTVRPDAESLNPTNAGKPQVGSTFTNSLDIRFKWVPQGSFQMGLPDAQIREVFQECRRLLPDCPIAWFLAEIPERTVLFKNGFWIGMYEVTQGQYEEIMITNPSRFNTCGKDCPVESVSWYDAKEFIKRLNGRNDGFVYSLPTEAEWEYAARAGTTTAFTFGKSFSSTQANFDGNYPYGNAAKGPYLERTTKVGSYRPNAWGIYDMHGNVWEWVEDVWKDNYFELPSDGSATATRGDLSQRVIRGGSWDDFAMDTRSQDRGRKDAKRKDARGGFRVVARPR